MKNTTTYSELLRDPRWQKKRLEIMAADLFRCRKCESKEKTLNVHHLYYIKGNNPWEYDNDALITLCEDCHKLAPSVNWQHAFLDLNITEWDLLNIAAQLHFRKKKHLESEGMKKHLEKWKCRLLFIYTCFDLFESEEEVNEYYTTFNNDFIKKYNG